MLKQSCYWRVCIAVVMVIVSENILLVESCCCKIILGKLSCNCNLFQCNCYDCFDRKIVEGLNPKVDSLNPCRTTNACLYTYWDEDYCNLSKYPGCPYSRAVAARTGYCAYHCLAKKRKKRYVDG